jgi:glycosyltransferase involved in cell wall biosynthesis
MIVIRPCLPGLPARPRTRGFDTPVHIIAAGRLEPGKHFHHVIELAATLGDTPCRFSIIGEGPAKLSLMAMAARMGVADRVAFPGQSDQLSNVLADADLLLHPSAYESFGMVVFEAMRAGVPVIGRRGPGVVCGYTEVLLDGVDGVLVEYPAARAVPMVRALIGDVGLRARMGAAASARAAELLASDDYAARVRGVLASLGRGEPT